MTIKITSLDEYPVYIVYPESNVGNYTRSDRYYYINLNNNIYEWHCFGIDYDNCRYNNLPICDDLTIEEFNNNIEDPTIFLDIKQKYPEYFI